MRQAIDAKSVRTEEQAKEVAEKKQTADLAAKFEGKTFEDLKKDEKDLLLKAVAIRLGIIEAS